jgi:hypothetical protein
VTQHLQRDSAHHTSQAGGPEKQLHRVPPLLPALLAINNRRLVVTLLLLLLLLLLRLLLRLLLALCQTDSVRWRCSAGGHLNRDGMQWVHILCIGL